MLGKNSKRYAFNGDRVTTVETFNESKKCWWMFLVALSLGKAKVGRIERAKLPKKTYPYNPTVDEGNPAPVDR